MLFLVIFGVFIGVGLIFLWNYKILLVVYGIEGMLVLVFFVWFVLIVVLLFYVFYCMVLIG